MDDEADYKKRDARLKIGTRKSPLALWQAKHVQSMLEERGLDSELITVETKGDLVLDRTLSKVGDKGLFTAELEDGLRSGEMDLAVHSAKDLPSELPEGLEILAFTVREPVHDVIVAPDLVSLETDEGLRLGTSSTRRVAQLAHYYPGHTTVSVRGNLQTRLRKLQEGECDALVLAYAGVYRMGFARMIQVHLPTETFTPAVGQGSLALEISSAMPEAIRQKIKAACHDEPTGYAVRAERGFLRVLEGGCSIPSFAYARTLGTKLTLTAGLIGLDGQTLLREDGEGPIFQPEALGEQVAALLLEKGGRELLDQIRLELNR